ncbi:uncharacterized protein LOC129576788 [Sitodiplosis mosellana]|uniref:uncharacterized protein LOC129576788 n=1 Tax=Sitodiplosis mosellana TaxID=263140 RepID=UPI002443D481|nr:uncharacterized protein LOC129576788 [Sitodiplosis mosellana]
MSSNNCKQFSPEDSKQDESATETSENREKKVCFICGGRTTLIINIHEPRCGPNMIDVISEKFKMRPLNDDKFLCYSCNNWLINWYTVQKKSDDSSHEDAQEQTTSSTMSAAITANAHGKQTATKTSDDHRHCTDANELIIVSDDDEENVENVDVNNVIQTLRDRLKKYLYYPNKQKCNDLSELNAHPQAATIIELNGTPDMHRNCERCGKLIRKHSNRMHSRQRTLCRTCRFSMRSNGKLSARLKIPTYHLTRSQYRRQKTHMSQPLSTLKRSESFGNRINIFKKLQQLGTSIYYENNGCRGKRHELSQHMTSIPHEMDISEHNTIQPNMAWKRPNESNEILMTFNTVVTEVFPIDQLYNYDRPTDQMPNAPNDFNIQDILRNVPKSLTITIA